MVLDRNPENYFAEVEQAAFEPANLVRGIGPSPDKMLLGRLFSYPDTHRYRIGTNYLQLPINAPKAEVHSYNKDGAMRYRHNANQPVYAPNSFGGPKADPSFADTAWGVEGGEIIRAAYTPHKEDDDFGQPGTLWREVLSDADKDHLVSNIVGHATNAVTAPIQERVIEYWTNVDPELGSRVAQGINSSSGTGSNGSGAANAPRGEEPVGSSASTGL
jgi:catalase